MKNWDEIRYFLAVARHGSVSAAAKEVGVSHATVLRHVDALEKVLGVKLFRRLQSGYRLSDVGETIYEGALEVESAVLRLTSCVEGTEEPSGLLRVTQPQVGAFDIYPYYAEFIDHYPGITLDVSPGYWDKNLNQQEADVAIVYSENPPDLLVGRKVGQLVFSAYASQKYLSRFQAPPQLENLEWIIMEQVLAQRISSRDNVWQQLFTSVPTPKIVMQTSSYPDIVAAVKSGLGVSFLAQVSAGENNDLVPIPGCQIANTRDVWILTHRDLRYVKRVNYFMDFMTARLREVLKA